MTLNFHTLKYVVTYIMNFVAIKLLNTYVLYELNCVKIVC